jgi:hypothetical protein
MCNNAQDIVKYSGRMMIVLLWQQKFLGSGRSTVPTSYCEQLDTSPPPHSFYPLLLCLTASQYLLHTSAFKCMHK